MKRGISARRALNRAKRNAATNRRKKQGSRCITFRDPHFKSTTRNGSLCMQRDDPEILSLFRADPRVAMEQSATNLPASYRYLRQFLPRTSYFRLGFRVWMRLGSCVASNSTACHHPDWPYFPFAIFQSESTIEILLTLWQRRSK